MTQSLPPGSPELPSYTPYKERHSFTNRTKERVKKIFSYMHSFVDSKAFYGSFGITAMSHLLPNDIRYWAFRKGTSWAQDFVHLMHSKGVNTSANEGIASLANTICTIGLTNHTQQCYENLGEQVCNYETSSTLSYIFQNATLLEKCNNIFTVEEHLVAMSLLGLQISKPVAIAGTAVVVVVIAGSMFYYYSSKKEPSKDLEIVPYQSPSSIPPAPRPVPAQPPAQPVSAQPTTQPVSAEPAPQPVPAEAPAQPVSAQPTTQPVSAEPAPQPVSAAPAPQPVSAAPTAQPVKKKTNRKSELQKLALPIQTRYPTRHGHTGKGTSAKKPTRKTRD